MIPVGYMVLYVCSAVRINSCYFRFPTEISICSLWERNVRRESWRPSIYSVLCSAHFEESCFDRTGQIVRVREGAVPTIFDFPQHLQNKNTVARKPPKNRSACVDVNSNLVELEVVASCTEVPAVPLMSDHGYATGMDADVPADLPQVSSGSVSIEHSYWVHETPKTLKRQLCQRIDELQRCRKRLKLVQQTARRRLRRIFNLRLVLEHLRKKSLVTDSCVEMLQQCFSGANLQIIMRRLAKKKLVRSGSLKSYPPELRSFALTLHFYSAKAYDYVREMFNFALPHPMTLRKWYKSVDGDAGFSTEALQLLRLYSQKASKKLYCSLVVDEMAIRKHVEWDGNKYTGYVDFGTGLDDDALPAAKEVLVFMVVAVDSPWKIPVGYFLIDGLSGCERANLVTDCLLRLHSIGVEIVSLTFDGSSSNIAMATSLGCSWNAEEPVVAFAHPAADGLQIQIFPDPCHMLKLMRNLLAERGTVLDGDGLEIKWSFVKNLESMQSAEGLRAGTKFMSGTSSGRNRR